MHLKLQLNCSQKTEEIRKTDKIYECEKYAIVLVLPTNMVVLLARRIPDYVAPE